MVPAYCANRLCWLAEVLGVWASLFVWLVGALPLRVRIGIVAYALVTFIVPSALLPKDLAEGALGQAAAGLVVHGDGSVIRRWGGHRVAFVAVSCRWPPSDQEVCDDLVNANKESAGRQSEEPKDCKECHHNPACLRFERFVDRVVFAVGGAWLLFMAYLVVRFRGGG